MRKKTRYPGTTSFTSSEEAVFFGRDEDIRQLMTSILVNPTTVLFGSSGTGKSSLIRAGILPELARHFSEEEDAANRYLVIDLDPKGWTPDRRLIEEVKKIVRPKLSLTDDRGLAGIEETDESLWYLLKRHQYNQANAGLSQNILFICDQAENIFTYPDPEIEALIHELQPIIRQYIPEYFRYRLREKRNASELTAIFHTTLPVKFLFAIRSDRLHFITRLKKASPLILQNSYELLPLNQEQAFLAIMKPAGAPGEFETEPFEITEAAAASIFAQLAGVNAGLDNIRIDPFSLQIVCSYIEEQLLPGQDSRVISDLELPDLKKVINTYYEESIESLPIPDNDKDLVRDFIETRMILNNRRIPLADVVITSEIQYHITQQTLDLLVEKRILKADFITGGVMYEITHDSFINPIMEGRSLRLSADKLTLAKNELHKIIEDKWDVYRKREAETKLFTSSRKEELNKKADITEATIPDGARYDSELYDLYKKLADVYILMKDYGRALKWYNFALGKPGAADSFLVDILKNKVDIQNYNGNLTDCINDLKSIIKLTPNDHAVISYFVELFDREKRLEDAIGYLTNEKVITDETVDIFTEIGFKYYRQNDYEKAILYFNVVLQRYPNDYQANRGMGIVRSMMGEYEAGRDFFNKAGEVGDNKAESFSDLGWNWYYQGELSLAIQCFETSVALDANNTSAALGLARSYYEADKLDEARKVYEHLLTIGDEKSQYLYNLGIVNEALEKDEKAISDYIKAIRLDPAFEDVHVRLAALLRGEPERLRQVYRDLIEEKPEAEKYYRIYLGTVLEQQQWLEDAEQEYRTAVAIDPAFVLAHYRLAETLMNLDRNNEAVEEFKRAADLEPTNAGIPCTMGYIYRHMGRYDEAMAMFNRAISLDPNLERNYLGLGGVYFRKLEYRNALHTYWQALSINNYNRIARASVAACYHQLGQEKECREQIELVRKHEKERADVTYSVYDSACIEALLGNKKEALRLLKEAFDNREITRQYASRDSDFYLFKEDPDFKDLLGPEVLGLASMMRSGSMAASSIPVVP